MKHLFCFAKETQRGRVMFKYLSFQDNGRRPMAHRTILVAALLSALTCQAQTMYKIVDADGRITYTDRPPPASQGQAVKPFGARPTVKQAADKPADSSVIEAGLQVYYKQIIVHSAMNLCRQLPGLAPKLAGAADASTTATEAAKRWESRHAALTQQKIVVLQDLLTQAELLKVADDAQRENNALLSRLTGAPLAERLTWCQRMPATLASLEFDLASNPVLVRKLMDYQPKKTPRP
jgi:hypothetical protein